MLDLKLDTKFIAYCLVINPKLNSFEISIISINMNPSKEVLWN